MTEEMVAVCYHDGPVVSLCAWCGKILDGQFDSEVLRTDAEKTNVILELEAEVVRLKAEIDLMYIEPDVKCKV